MDATSQSLIHLDVTDPRHTIFLPLCKILPTGSPNTVLLEGHHLDGTIAFKFANARDQSHFIGIAKKSSDMYSMVNDAYQDVRFISAGGKVLQESRNDAAPTICGVGLFIDYSKNGKSVTVREILPGSPAATSGLIQVHDHLLKIDRVSVKHSFGTLKDVVNAIRGIEGTKVCLQFRKCSGPEAKSVYEVTLKREPNVTVQEPIVNQNVDNRSKLEKVASGSEDSASNPLLTHEENGILRNDQDEAIIQLTDVEPLKAPSRQFSRPDENCVQESSYGNIDHAFAQYPSILSDSHEKLSGYVQALNSAAVGSGSTNVLQRPTLQGFATDLGVILFPTHDHRYTVLSIIPKSPASKRNIMIGDLLLAINREGVDSKSKEEVGDLLSHACAFGVVFYCHFQ
jgi:hypothetical protein